MQDNEENKDKVNEPGTGYHRPARVRIFHSFEEARESELEDIIARSPLERIRQTVELIIRTYGFSRGYTGKEKPDNHIHIRQYE